MLNQAKEAGDNAMQAGNKAAAKFSEKNPFSGTLKAAVELGLPMKCTYEANGAKGEGVIKGKQYAGQMSMEGKMGNVIIKEECMWSWEDGAESGIKTCFDTSSMEGEEGEESSFWDFEQNQNAANQNYTCFPTVVTDAAFTPPANVKFLDLDQMMQSGEVPDWVKEEWDQE